MPVEAERERSSRFDPARARPSAVGYCQLKTWAQATGRLQRDIPLFYVVAGYALQDWWFFNVIKPVHPDAEREVSVATVTGESTHPDIFIPSRKLAVQVKSCSKSAALNKVKKAHHTAQCLIEWASWHRERCCTTEDGRVIYGVPERYEVLLLCRDDYGITRNEIRVRWDALKAARLEAKLAETQFFIDHDIEPDCPYTKPTWECRDHQTGEACPLYNHCWCN